MYYFKRVIQSGNNPQVIVRSSSDQRQGVIRGNVITHIQSNQVSIFIHYFT